MKNNKKTDIKVGIIVILSIIILAFIYSWANNINFNSDKISIKINFNSVAGLDKGDAVMVKGVKKGLVEKITIRKNDVLVECLVDNDLYIYSDAKFTIMMLDLMGGKKIEIESGSQLPLKNLTEEFSGKFSGDISTAMAMISSVETDLVTIIKEISVAIHSINKTFASGNLEAEIKAAIANFNKVSSQMNLMLTENRKEIKEIIKQGSEFAKSGKEFFEENKQNMKITIESFNSNLKEAEKLLTKINTFADEIKAGKNNIGKVFYDKKLSGNLLETINKLNELTKIITEQLKNEGLNVDAHIF